MEEPWYEVVAGYFARLGKSIHALVDSGIYPSVNNVLIQVILLPYFNWYCVCSEAYIFRGQQWVVEVEVLYIYTCCLGSLFGDDVVE